MTTYPTIVGYDTLRTSSILSMKREILSEDVWCEWEVITALL